MIVVEVTPTGITIDGHAGFETSGKDIVCAAMSALSQNLIRSVKCLTEDRIEYQIMSGHITISYENLSESGKLLVDSFFIGVSEIMSTYPDYVQLA